MDYRSLQRITRAPGFFWVPRAQVEGDRLTLTGDEAHHASVVCRLAAGEMITVCDGEGNAFDCEIVSSTAREVSAQVVRTHRRLGEPATQVTLAVGVGKPASFDWIVEKSVELGVAQIIPMQVAESPDGLGSPETSHRRVERWRRLALGAMKQSLRSVWPGIDDVRLLTDVLPWFGDYQTRWLIDPEGTRIPALSAGAGRDMRVLVLVGPEAGFVESERAAILAAGALPLGLGQRRLRAETAAITALALIMHQMGEM